MLVGKLHAKAVLTEVPLAGLVPISKAAEKAKVPAVIVLHLILGGFLDRVVRLASQEGVGALLVDSDEVKRKKMKATVGLSSVDTFSTLKITREVLWRLVDQYQAIADLTLIETVGPDRSHKIWRFDSDSVARFKATFTTPARLAEQHDLQIGEVVRRLKISGKRPTISRAEVGIDFYRITDLRNDIFTKHNGAYGPHYDDEISRPSVRAVFFCPNCSGMKILQPRVRALEKWAPYACEK